MSVFQFSNKSSFDIIICIVSVILAIIAPNYYSYEYCLLLHFLFVAIMAYNVYKNRKDGLLNFNLLFSVSLYCTSFIYPVFIYNTPDRYSSMFAYEFDENTISYSTALAFVAYSFLQLGLNNKAKNIKQNAVIAQWSISKKGLNVLSFIFLVVYLFYVLNGGLSFFADQFIYSMSANDIIMGYVVQLITPIAFSMLIMAFHLPRRNCFAFYFSVGLVAVYALSILSTGSRTIPLAIIIMSLFLYNDKVRKIGISKLAILGVFFVITMVLAGALRGDGELITTTSISKNASDVLSEKQENYFMFANELIMCNRNLYFLVASTETVGYTYGVTLMGSVLSMVPFLRSLVIKTTGIPQYVLNSAEYNTFLTSGINHTKGMGTHAVADIYICWGILGVILLFYIYGYIITRLRTSQHRILYTVAYYIILSNAIYACRASILNLNQIVWTLFIVFIVLRLSGKKKNTYSGNRNR